MSTNPAVVYAAVTTSDTTNMDEFRGLYIGVGGNVSVVPKGGASGAGAGVVFLNAPSGGILPVRGIRVNTTGTTATNLVALY